MAANGNGHYIVGVNVTKGAYPSIDDAIAASHAITPMASVQVDARAINPSFRVRDVRAFTRVFIRAGYFEEIPIHWAKVAPLWSSEPTGVVFKARSPLNTDTIADVVKLMRSQGVEVPLLIELPAGSCTSDAVEDAIVRLAPLGPDDVGFVFNTAIAHASGMRIRTMREAYNVFAGWPVAFLRLIYLNGISDSGRTIIPHAESDIIWSGSPRAGVPELPWVEPLGHAAQKNIDIQASGVGLIVKYARYHNIPVIFEARASHNQEDILTFVRSCGRL